MIDHLEKQTQLLTLEQPKRGRGRPATGAAMTPAEKQKAYRQRLAEKRANQVPAAWHKADRAAQDERIVQLEQQLAEAQKDIALKKTQLRHWIERAETAEHELESRNGKFEQPQEKWVVQVKNNMRSKWKTITPKGKEFPSEAATMDEILDMPEGPKNSIYMAKKVEG